MNEYRIDKDNFEQQKAFELVASTNTSLFITGKAGTGKSTFIKAIQEEVDKNFIVLAPTGIAALNVGGLTMHSFFGFPLGVVCPGDESFIFDKRTNKSEMIVSREKETLLRKVDTIIIDEVSMVRADLVDGMDRYLRFVMRNHLPFGGKQMLFVGDLFQLPPVVIQGSSDEAVLHKMYGDGTPYFYKSNVLMRMNLPKIEFQHVYRQNDKVFMGILDRMRLGQTTAEDLALLNRNIDPNKTTGDFAVTLTSTNRRADFINDTRLAEIDSEEFSYEGTIEGQFRIQDSPVPEILRLRKGAQVIFCRNDFARGVVNGTIGQVSELGDDTIKVTLKNGNELNVERMTWQTEKRVYDEETHKFKSEVIGTFTQFPLKLAWAITIHKSQGMTFDQMHFDLAHGTFLPGQTYVAISRMRSLDGLTLSQPIGTYHIMPNAEVRAYANSFNDVMLIDDELVFGKLFYNHLAKKHYDDAALVCLRQSLSKMASGDYRNAALVAKKMFDVVLDDNSLMGKTEGVPLLKECSMTGNFLNAMLCLYSGRLDEAVGYADMVLARRTCLEALFIKGSALFRLECYGEAVKVDALIVKVSHETETRSPIDSKQYLFEMRLNQALRRSNIETCKHLLSRCPEYLPAHAVIREEALAKGMSIETEEGETENALITAFNNKEVSAADFDQLLNATNISGSEFRNFHRKVSKIHAGDVHAIVE